MTNVAPDGLETESESDAMNSPKSNKSVARESPGIGTAAPVEDTSSSLPLSPVTLALEMEIGRLKKQMAQQAAEFELKEKQLEFREKKLVEREKQLQTAYAIYFASGRNEDKVSSKNNREDEDKEHVFDKDDSSEECQKVEIKNEGTDEVERIDVIVESWMKSGTTNLLERSADGEGYSKAESNDDTKSSEDEEGQAATTIVNLLESNNDNDSSENEDADEKKNNLIDRFLKARTSNEMPPKIDDDEGERTLSEKGKEKDKITKLPRDELTMTTSTPEKRRTNEVIFAQNNVQARGSMQVLQAAALDHSMQITENSGMSKKRRVKEMTPSQDNMQARGTVQALQAAAFNHYMQTMAGQMKSSNMNSASQMSIIPMNYPWATATGGDALSHLTGVHCRHITLELPAEKEETLGIALVTNPQFGMAELKSVAKASPLRDRIPTGFHENCCIALLKSDLFGYVRPRSAEECGEMIAKVRSGATKPVKIEILLKKTPTKEQSIVQSIAARMPNQSFQLVTLELPPMKTGMKLGLTLDDNAAFGMAELKNVSFDSPVQNQIPVELHQDCCIVSLKSVAIGHVQPKTALECMTFMSTCCRISSKKYPMKVEMLFIQMKMPGAKGNSKKRKQSSSHHDNLFSAFWHAKETAKLFGFPNGSDVPKGLQQRIELLRKANEKVDGWKCLVPNDDKVEQYSYNDIARVRHKAQYLTKAYLVARKEMDKISWHDCCDKAADELNELGIMKYVGSSIRIFHTQFRANSMFPHPGNLTREGPNGRSERFILFEYFPLAKEMFLDIANKNIHQMTGRFMANEFREWILPELERVSRENGCFDDGSREQKLLVRLLDHPPNQTTMIKWLRRLNFEWDTMRIQKGRMKEEWASGKCAKRRPMGQGLKKGKLFSDDDDDGRAGNMDFSGAKHDVNGAEHDTEKMSDVEDDMGMPDC